MDKKKKELTEQFMREKAFFMQFGDEESEFSYKTGSKSYSSGDYQKYNPFEDLSKAGLFGVIEACVEMGLTGDNLRKFWNGGQEKPNYDAYAFIKAIDTIANGKHKADGIKESKPFSSLKPEVLDAFPELSQNARIAMGFVHGDNDTYEYMADPEDRCYHYQRETRPQDDMWARLLKNEYGKEFPKVQGDLYRVVRHYTKQGYDFPNIEDLTNPKKRIIELTNKQGQTVSIDRKQVSEIGGTISGLFDYAKATGLDLPWTIYWQARSSKPNTSVDEMKFESYIPLEDNLRHIFDAYEGRGYKLLEPYKLLDKKNKFLQIQSPNGEIKTVSISQIAELHYTKGYGTIRDLNFGGHINNVCDWLQVSADKHLPVAAIAEYMPAEQSSKYFDNNNHERFNTLITKYKVKDRYEGRSRIRKIRDFTEHKVLAGLSHVLGLFDTEEQSKKALQFIVANFIDKKGVFKNTFASGARTYHNGKTSYSDKDTLEEIYGDIDLGADFNKEFADYFMQHYSDKPEFLAGIVSQGGQNKFSQWMPHIENKPMPPLPIINKMPAEQAPTVYYKNKNNERMETLASQYAVKTYDEAEGLVALSNMLGLFNTEGGSMKSHSAKAMQYIVDHFIKKEVPALDLHKLYGTPDFTIKFNKKFSDFFMYHYSVDPKLFTEADTGVDMTMALLTNFDKILEDRPEKRIITRTDNKRLDPQEAIRMLQSANLNFDLLGDKKDDTRFQDMLRLISKFGATKEEVEWAIGLFERALAIDEEKVAIPNVDDRKSGLITFKSHLKSSPYPLISGKRTNTCTKFENKQKDRLERTVTDPDWRYVTFESPNLSYFDGYTWYDKEQKMACIDNIEGLFNNTDKRDKQAPTLLFESIIRYSDGIFKKLKSMDIPCSKINLGTGHSAISEVFTQMKKDKVIKDDPNPSNYSSRNSITSDAINQLTLTDDALLGSRRI